MALAHNTSIVRSGLVLHLDAANRKSYPGSGTTWTDLSGLGKNGTLINSVGFSSDNMGSMVFDGTNAYAEVLSPFYEFQKEITVAAFCKFNSFQYILSQAKKNTDTMTTNVWLWHQQTNGLGWFVNDSGTWRSLGTSTLSTNTWYYITTTAAQSGSKIFINGRFLSSGLGISTGIQNVSDSGIATNDYRYVSGRPPMNGNISDIKIYNRALTDAEIRQNFEALRDRYGI